MYNDELYHFGVKGMKWGVRRKRSLSDSVKDVKTRISKTVSEKRESVKKTTNKSSSSNRKFSSNNLSNGKKAAIAAVGAFGAYKISKLALNTVSNKRNIKLIENMLDDPDFALRTFDNVANMFV